MNKEKRKIEAQEHDLAEIAHPRYPFHQWAKGDGHSSLRNPVMQPLSLLSMTDLVCRIVWALYARHGYGATHTGSTFTLVLLLNWG
ncbi:hypothetical protein E2C01_000449 [Portunus trituberculatus]|uniref:Uncharacterized protein n=1 Tax=Portunus trituberculatus TaxID=210409 RepID=A0A5B7CE42_PORTR|nr:hypothetical protein [Portunus trituberculatus]